MSEKRDRGTDRPRVKHVKPTEKDPWGMKRKRIKGVTKSRALRWPKRGK